MKTIPKRFIRVWVGGKIEIPEQFEKWWIEFQEIHPDFEFVTITEIEQLNVPENLIEIIKHVSEKGTCAGLSDILRLVAVYDLGGIYIDTDVMPIKSFEPLTKSDKPFLGKRSNVSFESAIIGCPKGNEEIKSLMDKLPKWYWDHIDRSASVQTGPAFVSNYLFGSEKITHYPKKYFYPYNGFMAPKENEKELMFKNKENFPSMMYAAHFSKSKWGGKPNAIKKVI